MGDPSANWQAQGQVQLGQLKDTAQAIAEQSGQQAVTSALANAPATIQEAAKIIGAALTSAISGYLAGVALPTIATAALAEVGISAAIGAEAGPLGAVVGAVVGTCVAIAETPAARGSGPLPPDQAAILQIVDSHYNATGAFLLAGSAGNGQPYGYYWDKVQVDYGWGTNNCGGGFGSICLADDQNKIAAFYQNLDATSNGFLLGENARLRMPRPDLMEQLLYASFQEQVRWGAPNDKSTDGDLYGFAGSYSASFASVAMCGGTAFDLMALCDTLSAAQALSDVNSLVIPALNNIKQYYNSVQGTIDKLQGPGGPLHWPAGLHLVPGGINQHQAPATGLSTGAKVAIATPVVAVGGSLLYAYITKQTVKQVYKRAWEKTKRIAGLRR